MGFKMFDAHVHAPWAIAMGDGRAIWHMVVLSTVKLKKYTL
jgi:hypothetical protein